MNITIGVLTINKWEETTKNLVDSIWWNGFIEFILVDNGGKIEEDYFSRPNWIVKVIHPEKNLGIAGGWNEILRHVTNEQVFILNDDIVLNRNTIHTLYEDLATYDIVSGYQVKEFSNDIDPLHIEGMHFS